MQPGKRLLDVAEVLEKTAAYIEAQESEQLQAVHAAKPAEAQELAAKIENVVGEEIDTDTVNKLAELSPELSTLMARLSGGDAVDSLGGPSEAVKTASITSSDQLANNVAAANASFLDFLQT